MKTIKYSVRHVIPILLALVLALGMTVTAYAADTASLDFTQTGSVELSLQDSEGNAVSGGAVTIYEVAVLYLDDGNMAYTYTDAFDGCEVTLDVEDTSLAAALAAYVESEGISGDTTADVGTDGTVSFTGLELGLYLIVQTTDSADYETINPFVVTVPIESDGAWVYTVDASPKVGTVTPVETEEETSTEETTEETEEETEEESEEETEEETTTAAASSSSSGSTTLPQTGQLNWPIPILAVSGLLLFMAGWYLNRTGRKQEEHAK